MKITNLLYLVLLGGLLALPVHADDRPIRDFESDTFGYRFQAKDAQWFGWTDLDSDYDTGDIGVLSMRSQAAVVIPFCWQGEAPPENLIYRLAMQQFGEDYPAPFIEEEHDIQKGDASGKLFIGHEESDGENYRYHFWVVKNDQCAYTVGGWGPKSGKLASERINRLWRDFEIRGGATASEGKFASDAERSRNAGLINGLGIVHFENRSYREAYRWFQAALAQDSANATYLTNTLRSLTEIEAFGEAKGFLAERFASFEDDTVVRSWVAWLAYKTDDYDAALEEYRRVFESEYRNDEDFAVYMELLADRELWPELDRQFAAYTAEGVTDATRLLQVQILTRRGEFEQALAELDALTAGKPYNPEHEFERIVVLDKMGKPAEIIQIAESLIEKGYPSLGAYFYKGDAEYQLGHYQVAKTSFEQAKTYSPANETIQEYLDAIDRQLGQGDVSMVSRPIKPVALPKSIEQAHGVDRAHADIDAYGAVYVSRLQGYEFDGSELLRESHFQRILVSNDAGIETFSTLQVTFDPAYEQLYINTLQVLGKDGNELGKGDLSSYYITSSEDGYAASTEKTLHLPVPGLAAGATIEFVYTKATSVEAGTFPMETHYLAGQRPVLHTALFVQGKSAQLSYSMHNAPAPAKTDNTLIWQLENPVIYRWEPMLPSVDEILPFVKLGTTDKDWATVSDEYLELIRDKLEIKSIAERAAALIDGVTETDKQIETLSRFVQREIRYEAIEFGRRAYIPKTARQTLRDRYGDCKDHAVLLYAMLKAVDIDASLALVNLEETVDPGLPESDQFNHMVVVAHADGARQFIDPTDKDLRLVAMTPRYLGGNFALLLGDRAELVQLPDYGGQKSGFDLTRDISLVEEGYIRVKESATLGGYMAADLRSNLRQIDAANIRPALQRWVAGRYDDAELLDHFIENQFEPRFSLVVELEYRLPVTDVEALELPAFLEAYYLDFDRLPDRRFPFEFEYPIEIRSQTRVQAPSGEFGDASEKNEQSKYGKWTRTVEKTDSGWTIDFDFAGTKFKDQASGYADFIDFQRSAIRGIETKFSLR